MVRAGTVVARDTPLVPHTVDGFSAAAVEGSVLHRRTSRSTRIATCVLLALAALASPASPVRASTFTVAVNDPTDEIHPGLTDCPVTGAGTCSLRDAVLFANTKTS